MDCSRRRVLECIAPASERCNAIDTLCRNHVHNKLTEGPEPAHSLDADIAHSTKTDPTYPTKHRTSQGQRAQTSSPPRDSESGFPSSAPHLWPPRDHV